MLIDVRRVLASVDEEGVIDLLREMVRIPSPSEGEEAISEFVAVLARL